VTGEQRRLAAIVSADVVGYSRLMGRDEAGTLSALKAVRREVVDPAISRHNGRLVKTTGDGLLLEFSSIVGAMRCVIEVQTAMAAKRASMVSDRRIDFRFGVNLGDIIVEDDDIFGDGVNVAARLQELAPPGGVAVSGRVHDDIVDRLEARFEDIGPQTLKNIARPVPVWRWLPNLGPTTLGHRQATIVVTDVNRFNILMKRDVATTLAMLTSLRHEVIDPLASRYGGRLVKPLGDGEMLEFPKTLSAVRFVLDMQEAVTLRGADTPEDQRIAYTIGVNVGDVFVLNGDLVGESANIAFLIEKLAEPGSACISDAVYRKVHGKIDATFIAMGEKRLRIVEQPVTVGRLHPAKTQG
jgi:class 3 adenylate cyclase